MRGVEEFGALVAVPPDTEVDAGRGRGDLSVLDVEDARAGAGDVGGGGPVLVAGVAGVDVGGAAPADVEVGFARRVGRVLAGHQALPGVGVVVVPGRYDAQFGLLDREALQAGPVGVEVGDVETVAVSGTVDDIAQRAVAAHDVVAVGDLVLAVLVDVDGPDLVEAGGAAADRDDVLPTPVQIRAVEVPGLEEDPEGSAFGADPGDQLRDEAGMYAVEVRDAEVSAGGAVGDEVVGHGLPGALAARLPVDHRNELVGGRVGGHLRAVREGGPVGRVHQHLGLAVAVEVVHGDVVVVAVAADRRRAADRGGRGVVGAVPADLGVRARAEVDAPQPRAGERVRLQEVGLVAGLRELARRRVRSVRRRRGRRARRVARCIRRRRPAEPRRNPARSRAPPNSVSAHGR